MSNEIVVVTPKGTAILLSVNPTYVTTERYTADGVWEKEYFPKEDCTFLNCSLADTMVFSDS